VQSKRILSLSGVILLLSGCSGQAVLLAPSIKLPPAGLAAVQIVAVVVMLAGLISLFTLIIPGLTIIWLSALAYGLLTGVTTANLVYFSLITVLMIFGNIVDQLLMGAKARQSGASWTGIFLSTIAAFVFSFLLPPFGGIIASLLVLFIYEFIRLRDWRKAGGTTKEMAIGCASAVIVRFFIGIAMISLWVMWVWQSGKLPF
jgi:uncharacterized protein YqgC (DUF456 family)